MNKYHARRTQGVGGIWFRSMLEANYAQQLELRRHAEDPRERVDWWTCEVPFTLPTIPGRRAIRHIVDFIFSQGGCLRILEVKGKETPAGRVKRLWLETYLGHPIEVWKGDTRLAALDRAKEVRERIFEKTGQTFDITRPYPGEMT